MCYEHITILQNLVVHLDDSMQTVVFCGLKWVGKENQAGDEFQHTVSSLKMHSFGHEVLYGKHS